LAGENASASEEQLCGRMVLLVYQAASCSSRTEVINKFVGFFPSRPVAELENPEIVIDPNAFGFDDMDEDDEAIGFPASW
jgi:hypothetical protein